MFLFPIHIVLVFLSSTHSKRHHTLLQEIQRSEKKQNIEHEHKCIVFTLQFIVYYWQ